MVKDKVVLLTFDVEEFDLPLEYELYISSQEQMHIGKLGTDAMKKILDETNIASTLFITANFAKHFPSTIKSLAEKNEIGSHSFYHSSFIKEDLAESKICLEGISGTKISGLRMPRFKKVDLQWVKEAGYLYDSSINPTYIPGRYNNRHLPRTIYREAEITRVPISVSPNIRFPLFWMTFKNFPYSLYKKMAFDTLKKDGYLSLYFHPWEFTDISKWNIPFYLKKHNGDFLSERIIHLINDLKKEADFQTISNFLPRFFVRQ